MQRWIRRVGVIFALVLVAGLPGPPPAGQPAAGADESYSDVALFDPASGKWHLRYADGTNHDFYYGVPGDTALMGDFDCDGIDTVAMYRESTGFVYLRHSNEFGVGEEEFYYGIPGDIPIAGDWDGDGCDTFGIYRQGTVFLSNQLGTRPADVSFYFGVPGDRPFAGDFNGDGIDTIGLYRDTSGFVYLTNSIPAQDGVAPTDASFFYGVPSDRILAGDWDQDGDDSVGIYRPSDRTFYLSYENQLGFADRTIYFGESGWMPAAGAFGPGPPVTPPPAIAGVSWESMGGPPGAGRVYQLIQSTGPTHSLHALVQDHGVYSSADRGETWAPVTGLDTHWVSSIAARGSELIVCGDGVHSVQPGTVGEIRPDACEAVATDTDTVVVARGYTAQTTVQVYRRDGSGPWQDLSTGPSDLGDLVLPPAGLEWSIAVPSLGVVGDDLLAGFTMQVEGSGEFTNGGLYRWTAASGTWSRVTLPAPAGVVVAKLIVDPQDANRVVATLRHPMVHEFRDPISQMVFESLDGGASWQSLTTASLETNGVTDVVAVAGARYLLNPFDNYMLRVDATGWATLPMPVVSEHAGQSFNLETLLIDPSDSAVAYGMPGSIWELGLIRSTDGMATWHKMDETIIGSSPTIVVTHPTDPDVVLTSGNVIQESYQTRDGGVTWDPFSPVASGDELRIDPHDGQHLLLVDETTAMYESLDGGRSFTPTADEFTGGTILDFEISPDDPDLVYVSNLGVGISRLDGEEPRHLTNSPDYSYDIEIDPDDDQVLYATNSPKPFEDHSSVWRYSPAQSAAFGWSEILRVEDSAGITSLRFDPSDSDTLYAGVTGREGTVWMSTDRGSTWAELNPALTFTTVQGHSQVAVSADDEDTAYVGTWGGGSFRTSDGGATWSKMDEAHTFSPTCLVSWPADPDILYACDRTAPKVHKSLDGGATWSEYFDFGPGHLTTTAIAIDPTDHDHIYAAAFQPPAAILGSLYEIRDGRREADLSSGLPRAVLEIEIDEQTPATLYATTHLHGLFKSENAGTSWTRLDDRATGLPRTGYLDVAVDPHDSNTLYASSLCGAIPDYVIDPVRTLLGPLDNIDPAAKCGVYKSSDAGTRWDLILETAGEAKGIDLSRTEPGRIFVADSGSGVWVSNDGGAAWRQENTGLGTTSVTGLALGNRAIYAGTQGSGVYIGTVAADGSISWRGDRSPRVYVYRIQIEVDPANPSRLYASAYPGGVLRSDDGGSTWSAKNFLTPSIRVTDPALQGYYALDIDPSNSETVWLGVYGKGLIVSHDGRDFGTAANGSNELLRGKHITAVQVDPLDPSRVLVGAEEGVFVTNDGGSTWTQMNDGLGTSQVRSLKLSTAQFTPFTADFDDGTSGGFELENGWSVGGGVLSGTGHSWARAGSSAWTDYTFVADVRLLGGELHMSARVAADGRYFVNVRPGGLTLSKQFNQWQEFADLAQAAAPVALGSWHEVAVKLDGARIRVYVDGGLEIDYTDSQPMGSGAVAFESLDGASVTVDNVEVVPAAAPSQPFAGTAGYSLYRLNPGEEWSSLGSMRGGGWWAPWERRMYQFSSILFDPLIEDRVYYGHFPGGFFISEDGGDSWSVSSIGLGNDGMFSLSQHPGDATILFAGTYNGVVTSIDGGATWADSSAGMPPEQWPYTVAIDDARPNVMYTSTKNGQNQGFCQRNQFCGVVMKSTDGGRTWHRIMSGLNEQSEFYTLLIYPLDHDTLFLSTSRGVYVSLDAGENWWPMNTGLPSTNNQVRDNVADNLALTPDHRYLIFGLVKRGVWRADLQQLG